MHKLLSHELLGGGSDENTTNTPARRNKNKGLPLNNRLRWMVFKAKQRARSNYYEKVVKKPNIIDTIEAMSSNKKQYNWPYDFFSLVELINIEAKTIFTREEEVDDVGTTSTVPQTASPNRDMKIINPNIQRDLQNPASKRSLRSTMLDYSTNSDDEGGI